MLDQLKSAPDQIQFSEVIEFIEKHYTFTPTCFTNGNEVNEAGQNNGSCKILSFAKMKGLTKAETLNLFGDYYRKDVLLNPNGKDHQNIRNFMNSGWEGVQFDGEALEEK
ncbi:HopJ type III effector protein [Algoriphagus ornithinivorans]|uniref:HopJ type III effector protein n=1 Tax=Algoriphagus ornithinivorans TaxID=226506 RepID=A0A1I5AGA7_9BACT|nr:HopJ type III effector protein [Algoriphagus ornithinivorans]SFN61458.1 HopJ type III effector protein [Algoriphagus ornithinivorans]